MCLSVLTSYLPTMTLLLTFNQSTILMNKQEGKEMGGIEKINIIVMSQFKKKK